MNNKELTELKKIDEIKEEFIKEFVNNHNPYGWRWLRGIYIEDIWDFFLPHLKSNDEIKREAVENFRNWVINRQTEDGYKYKMWYEYIEEYLTQKENNE